MFMKILSKTFAAAALLFVAGPAFALEGVYNTGVSESVEDQGGTLDVEFGPCLEAPDLFCGTVIAVNNPDASGDGAMPNGEPVIGFVMIRDLEPRKHDRYRDGKINAVDESIDKDEMIWYSVKIDALENGDIEVRGCAGFLCGRTMLWKRIDLAPAS